MQQREPCLEIVETFDPEAYPLFLAIKPSSSSWPPLHRRHTFCHYTSNSSVITPPKMTSFCLPSSVSSSLLLDWKMMSISSSDASSSSSGRQNTTRRKRRRCALNQYFTKTGFFLILGVITLAALPHCVFCRPVKEAEARSTRISNQFNVYAPHSSNQDPSTGLLTSSSRRGSSVDSDEEASSRFEFQRKITSSSSNKPDALVRSSDDSKNVHSLEIIPNSRENNDNSALLGGNSSMIVHVIVTSSSSSSGGSLEFDETDNNSKQDSSSLPEDGFQYTVSDDDGEGSLVAESSSDSHVSTSSSSSVSTSTGFQEHQNLKKRENENLESIPPKQSQNDEGGELELKKLPKSENETPDIFSAFYRAFSQTQTSSPSQPEAWTQTVSFNQDKTTSFPAVPTTDETITTFKLPPRSDFRQRPSSFQLFQQRRRLFRNRQLLDRKSQSFSTQAPEITWGKSYDKNESVSVEETARKLEFLAKKLDKSEHEQSFRGQENKILVVSSSSSSSLITTTTTQVPFLLSQPPPPSSSFSSPKIAVSVTHSQSVVASAAATSAARKNQERNAQESQQEVVVGNVRSNAKSETTFPVYQQESEKIHGTYSYFTRPRPLIKSLSKNKELQNDYINNNKNRSDSHNFSRNFSTHGSRENGIFGKTFGSNGADSGASGIVGNVKSPPGDRSNGNNHDNDKVNEDNFRVQDRFNIISSSRDGGNSPLSSDSPNSPAFAISSGQATSFFESTSQRPSQRRKITRTVSSDIGNPSSFYFNVNLNYRSTPRSSSKVPVSQEKTESPQSTPKPVVNWQQPEKIWSEPAQVWGVPAKVWGEPARVWGEPAKIWGQPEKVWAKTLEDEMMQSDQPPEERKAEDEADSPVPGTFVILGDDENEGDSIDGDLGRPLMLHHFTVPPNKQKETVSVSTSVSSSVSSNNKTIHNLPSQLNSRAVANNQSPIERNLPQQGVNPSSQNILSGSSATGTSASNLIRNNSKGNQSSSESDGDEQGQNKKSGKKFGYVIEGANVRKYRVEERTPDGYIVGEYGVLNNQNAFLRGVRYTADGTINPRLIHEALMKFLSLRR